LGKNIMTETEAVAKAIEQCAKLGEKGLETSEKLGGFFAKVFIAPTEEIAGMVTDKLRFVRWKRVLRTVDEVNRILAERGVRDTRAVAPKLALPIFEESSLEEDDTLHSMWNALLANAMDPSFTEEIRFAYTDIIRNLAPLDARMLREIYAAVQRAGLLDFDKARNGSVTMDNLCQGLKISEEQYLISVNNLMRLRVLAPRVILVQGSGQINISGGERLTIDKGTDQVVITPLGIRFIESCAE